MKPHPPIILDYNQITPQIYIGTNMCCLTHFEEGLAQEGIHADFSVEQERVDSPFGADYYFWTPVKDHEAPRLNQLHVGIKILGDLLDAGCKVYVHCKNGHGRAPTFVAAYLLSKGNEVEEVVNMIKAARPSIHLQAVQLQILKDYYAELHKN